MAEPIAWPVKSRETNRIPCDSSRWNDFRFRDDDIVIATWSKAGTTWTQQIVAQLIFGGDPEVYGQMLSPWIDGVPMPHSRELAEAQQHRRFLKTHLAIDALVYSPKAKYIYVGRDARDVFWSWHHHHSSFTDEAVAQMNQWAQEQSVPLLQPPNPDIRAAYLEWLESDGGALESFWDNVQGWWDHRHLPNLMLLHYQQLKADPRSSVIRIAEFLGVPLTGELLDKVLRNSGFDHMKLLAAHQEFLSTYFKGGGDTFINKGTNGRWRDVLSEQEIARCDEVAAERLSPDCAQWLRTGEMPVS